MAKAGLFREAGQRSEKVDKRTLTVLSAAVPAANVVEVSGQTLTDTALNEAISIIEDLELTVKYIIMRGRRFNDMRDWELDPQTQFELRTKGVIKNYGTGGILLTSAMPLNEILIVPDEGLAEKGGAPVERHPAKRRSHGWRRPGFFAKQDSEAKKWARCPSARRS